MEYNFLSKYVYYIYILYENWFEKFISLIVITKNHCQLERLLVRGETYLEL